MTSGPTRRQFVQAVAAAGAGLLMTQPGSGQDTSPKPPDELRLALIGAGSQGLNLVLNCTKIPGVRFAAVADIWPYRQTYARNVLRVFKQPINTYADHREMLSAEKDLDAVIVATPDWVHAEQTIACLAAGLHVYCEKEMSNTIEGARSIVAAAKKSGKVVQIGHQRRSNPRYHHALKVIEKDKLLGRITHANGQWNRARLEEIGWPKGKELDSAALKKHGYDTMERLCNWRWYKRYSGGAMADLGSHQVDVFNWFLHARPTSVMATGGLDYYKGREWYDNVMCLYEYHTAAGVVRAFYQVLNTSSYGGYFEAFLGDEGSMVISEDVRKGYVFREIQAPRRKWEDEAARVEQMGRQAIQLKIGETLDPSGAKTAEGQKLLAESKKLVHQLHLENFFAAVRKGDPSAVSCPPDVGFETAVSVLKANDAVEAARAVPFKPEEFNATS